MRYTINKINKGEDELILNYKEKNPEVEAVLLFMDKRQRKLIGRKNDETIVFTPEEILYIEKVDNKTFVYTDDNEIQVGSIPHPMSEEHHIEFIETISENKQDVKIKFLNISDEPKMEINSNKNYNLAIEYCNLHGLWKNNKE